MLLSADWTFIHFVQSSPGLAKVKRILQDMRIIHARNLPVSVIMILKIDIDIYFKCFCLSKQCSAMLPLQIQNSTYRFTLKDFHLVQILHFS